MKKRILLVDDHPIVRRGIRSILDDKYDVCGEAENGKDAIDRAVELRPDLVVMDINMPVMNGIEATRELRSRMPQLKIVILSMHESGHSEALAKREGADAFLTKMSAPADLTGTIDELLSSTNGAGANHNS